MGMFSANPQAEVSAGFEAVKPGTYHMRYKTVVDRADKGKTDYECLLEHTLPKEELVSVEGMPLRGLSQNVYSYLSYASDKQGMLKAATLAAGLPWADYDPAIDLVGKEIDVVLKVEVYQGENKNKVARFVVPK